MNISRLEAFSDVVLALVITIMVLELPIPQRPELGILINVLPKFLAYLLSFIFLGICWNQHHHLLKEAKQVTTRIMWANLHLLFWLSLIPYGTAWLGDHYTQSGPVAFYGVITLACALACHLLQRSIAKYQSSSGEFKPKIGMGLKGKISLLFYILGIALAFVAPLTSVLFYVAVAVMWFIPDRRLEAEKIDQ